MFERTVAEKLKNVGVHFCEQTEDKDSASAVIAGEIKYYGLPKSALAGHAEYCYQGNEGFFYLTLDTGCYLLLKLSYSDGIRVLKKPTEQVSEKNIYEISRTLALIESHLEGYFDVDFFLHNDNFYIAELHEVTKENYRHEISLKDDRRNPRIPRPLTAVEYASGLGDYEKDDALFARGLFINLLPESVTPLMSSVLNLFPDALNIIFSSFDIKTDSPSIKLINNRLYSRVSNYEKAYDELRIDKGRVFKQLMPWVKKYRDYKPQGATNFFEKLIEKNEIELLLAEMPSKVNSCGKYNYFEPTFFEPIGTMILLAEYLYYAFNESYTKYCELLKINDEEGLKIIYKTRQHSLFTDDKEITLPLFFDPIYKTEKVNLASQNLKTLSKDKYLSELSGIKYLFKKSKIISALEQSHFLLDCRDKLFREICEYYAKFAEYSLEYANYAVSKNKIKSSNDFYFFEFKECKTVINDSFYSNIPQTVSYRKSNYLRGTSQPVPYEIYEKDIPSAGHIAEDQIARQSESLTIPCYSYNSKEISGIVKRIDIIENGTINVDHGDIVVSRSIPLSVIQHFANAKAIIIENNMPFGYLTEFCFLNDIPLYYGVRYAPLILDGKKIRTSKDNIAFESEK